jgi:hypothetical protein
MTKEEKLNELSAKVKGLQISCYESQRQGLTIPIEDLKHYGVQTREEFVYERFMFYHEQIEKVYKTMYNLT